MSARRLAVSVVLVLAGVACVVWGVAQWSVPAAVVLAGLVLVAAGAFGVDVGGGPER